MRSNSMNNRQGRSQQRRPAQGRPVQSRPAQRRPVQKKKVKRRRRRRGFGRFIFLVVLIVLLVVGGLSAYRYFTDRSYDDEKSFAKYAGKYFDEVQESDKIGESKEDFDYGKPVSLAANYPVLGFDALDKRIKDVIDEKNADYEGEFEYEDPEKKFAQLTGYDSYKSDKKTGSVVLKMSQIEENAKGDFKEKASKVETFTFGTEKGSEIYPVMAFESGYQEKLSKHIKSELEETYGDDLIDGYEDVLDPKKNKFDKFALTKNGAIFYFDSGVITDSTDIVAVEVDEDDVKGVFREKINPRALDPTKPMVALTYDDGPAPEMSDRILDVFEQHNAVATFFELGQNVANVKNSEEILKRMDELGCEIGSHSWNHPNMFQISDAAIKEQNDKTDKIIEEKVGHKPTVYRPPYGNGNDKTTKIFNKPGILWSVDTMDWSSKDANKIVNVVKNTKDLDGKVVLMHSLYDFSAKATEELVPWLQEQGYQLVTVSELLTYKYNVDPSVAKFYGYNYFYLNK